MRNSSLACGLCLSCTNVEVRTGTYRQLLHPEQLISGEETSPLISHADLTSAKRSADLAFDRTMKLADTHWPQGFLAHNACAVLGLWSQVSASGTYVRRLREEF